MQSFRFSLIVILTSLLLLSCVEKRPQKTIIKEPTVSTILYDMVTEDVKLRMAGDTLDYSIIFEADRRHREKVYELLAQGVIIESQDLFQAAYILQHADPSSCLECYLLAYNLSLEAVRKGCEKGRYMVALNLDRYLVFSGKPQKYGTQSNIDSTGISYLFPIDTLTSDSERAIWTVPPLDSLKAQIDRENTGK